MDDDPPAPPAPGETPPLPPARSGPRVLILISALVLLLLGALWYASFLALNARGPERAFFQQESWSNGTIVLVVTEIVEGGRVPVGTLTAAVVSSSGASLYNGSFNRSQTIASFSITLRFEDRDNSSTLSLWDAVAIDASPPEALDALILANFYLYSDGREWAFYQIGRGRG